MFSAVNRKETVQPIKETDTCLKYELLGADCTTENIDQVVKDCENLSIPNEMCNKTTIENVNNYCKVFGLEGEDCNYNSYEKVNSNIENRRKCSQLGIPDHMCKGSKVQELESKCETLGLEPCRYDDYVNYQVDQKYSRFKNKPKKLIKKCIKMGIPTDTKGVCNEVVMKNVLRNCEYFPLLDYQCNYAFLNDINNFCEKKGIMDTCNKDTMLQKYSRKYNKLVKKHFK